MVNGKIPRTERNIRVILKYISAVIRIMPVRFEEYRDKPIIVLFRDEDDEYPFRFGVSKAKLILEHIKQIEDFVRDHMDD